MYYDNDALHILGLVMGGRVEKIDSNTMDVNWGKFARLCMEIDLNLPIVGNIMLYHKWQRVSYKGLHIICTCCRKYGHLACQCTTKC